MNLKKKDSIFEIFEDVVRDVLTMLENKRAKDEYEIQSNTQIPAINDKLPWYSFFSIFLKKSIFEIPTIKNTIIHHFFQLFAL